MDPPLVRLNFVAILSALDALATGSVEKADPRRYEELPVNESGLFYILVRNGPSSPARASSRSFADIGISASRRVRNNDGQRTIQISTSVNDIGDLRTSGALRVIDAAGLTIVPGRRLRNGCVRRPA